MGKHQPLVVVVVLLNLSIKSAEKADLQHGESCKGKSDYSDWGKKPYCYEKCKTIGIRGNVNHLSGIYGIYTSAGDVNYRTKYEKPGGWTLSYGCQENALGGDSEAWMVTKNGKWTGSVLYSPWQTMCPSDTGSRKWWHNQQNKRGAWIDSNRQNGVEVACNPANEADFLSNYQYNLGKTNSSPPRGSLFSILSIVVPVAVAVVLLD